MSLEFDTIAAVSTPPGEGAIGIVRLSGDEALAVADKVYQAGKKQLAEVPSHTIHYGHIIDPKNNGVIDEVMVSVMREPKPLLEKMWLRLIVTEALRQSIKCCNLSCKMALVWQNQANLRNVLF